MKRIVRVVFQPRVYRTLQRGINQMVGAVRPTYGPLHGTVMLERIDKVRRPEVLDDGGMIARRIIQLPDRDEDVGAMMVRHLMWRMRERFGDMTVTAALIYQSVFNQGVRYISNGGNAMRLRACLEKGAQRVFQALGEQALPAGDEARLIQLAESIGRDPALAVDLGRIFARVGQHGTVQIKAGRGRESVTEYRQGLTWKGEFLSRNMVQDRTAYRSEIEKPRVLVSNLVLDDPYRLAKFLERVMAAGIARLLLLVRQANEPCLAVLEAARKNPENFDLIGVKLFETTERWELTDLAAITGGRLFAREAGYTLDNVQPEHLGCAGRVWVQRSQFGLIDGGGDPGLLEKLRRQLISGLERTHDKRLAERLRERIAQIAGISAILHIGGATQVEIEAKAALAERTANAMRGAISDGVLPGGATAYLACLPALDDMHASPDDVERAAAAILRRALVAPIRALLENCGENPDEWLPRIQRRGAGYGYDVRRRKVVNMAKAGVLDTANAARAAAYAGITGAALGLTVDVVVHPKKRKESFTTG